jgi:hypothetical protein
MNVVYRCLLVVAFLVAFERISFAQSTEPFWRAKATLPTASVDSSSGPWRFVWSDGVEADSERLGLRLCHLSHHPRDGVRPALQACPLFVAFYGRVEPPIDGVAMGEFEANATLDRDECMEASSARLPSRVPSPHRRSG